MAQWARRLRTRFQLGLVGWIRGERPEQNLEILETVAHQLEQVATRQPVFQLWWVVGAIIEALRDGGLETGVSIKRLMGLADREILQLYTQGEGRYAQNPPVELLNNLLYYAARATSDGPKVTAVRASFRLNELLLVDDSVEQERENLSAPSVKLMRTVSAAIREDLGKVKDVLDIYVRRGGQPAELEAQVGMLRKIGDTLGVLGLGELRQLVLEETGRLEAMAAGKTLADHAALVHIAATLINVEDRLDRDLIGLIVPKAQAESPTESVDAEFQQVQAAVLRECSVNLVRVKEAIASNVAGTLDVGALDAWPGLIQGIKSGLLMLGKTRAVEIVDGIARNLKELLQPGGTAVPPNYLDRLADAVVSLEYYMETLQAGRTDPWYMLDNAADLSHGADADAQARGAHGAAAGSRGLRRHGAAGGCRRHGARARAAGRGHAAHHPGRPHAAPVGAAAHRRQTDQHRSRAAHSLYRGSARRGGPDRQAVPGLGTESARDRSTGRRAPCIPHAQGLRPHGRRHATSANLPGPSKICSTG